MLEGLSARLTENVGETCRAVGLRPPGRVILSLNRLGECRLREDCSWEVCGYYDCEREEVVLSLPCVAYKAEGADRRAEALLMTIAHELVHRCQHVGGPFCEVRQSCEDFRTADVMLPYKRRPHEVEAYAKAGELAEAMRRQLEGLLKEVFETFAFVLKVRNPPPLMANALYVEPGGRAELLGDGFTAELAGRAEVRAPALLYWPGGTFFEEGGYRRTWWGHDTVEIRVDLLSPSGEVPYVILGDRAVRLYEELKREHSLEKGGKINESREAGWLSSIQPEWVKRREGYFEISFPQKSPGGELEAAKVLIGERTLGYYEFMFKLELVRQGKDPRNWLMYWEEFMEWLRRNDETLFRILRGTKGEVKGVEGTS